MLVVITSVARGIVTVVIAQNYTPLYLCTFKSSLHLIWLQMITNKTKAYNFGVVP